MGSRNARRANQELPIMSDEKLVGVLAIMTAPDGRVIATAADFERQAPGGYKLWEAQRYRARQQVKWATVRAYSSEVLVQAISDHMSEQIAAALCQKGHRLTIKAIGWDGEAAAEVER
jgi:hypothetical protein